MPKKSKTSISSPDTKEGTGIPHEIPHVARITLLGLSGLTCENNANAVGGTKTRKSRGSKVLTVPEPSDVRAFVSLTRQTVIGTKFLPPLCHTIEGPVHPATEDVEIASIIKPRPDDIPDHYHIIWPEDGASGRENKFVFETLLPESASPNRQGSDEITYTPKVFNLEIGLHIQQAESEKTGPPLDELFGIALGSSSLIITGHESCPPKLSDNTDLSTTIFSQVQYLPISKPVGSVGHSKRSKLNQAVRVLKNNHKDLDATSSNDNSRRKKTDSNPPSNTEVEAFQSKYSFKNGQGFLVVTVEVYKKASDEEQRIDFIRKQIKKQALNLSTPGMYQMVRYLASSDSFSSEKYISRAIYVYAQSATQSSTENMVHSSESDPTDATDSCMVIASMSSLMDDESDGGSESSSDSQESSTDEEKDSNVVSANRATHASPTNSTNSFFSRINSCSAPVIKDIPKSQEMVVRSEPSSSESIYLLSSQLTKASLKGITDFLTCRTRVDPALLIKKDEGLTTKPIVKTATPYDDDQTIFSGIPYVSDQKL